MWRMYCFKSACNPYHPASFPSILLSITRRNVRVLVVPVADTRVGSAGIALLYSQLPTVTLLRRLHSTVRQLTDNPNPRYINHSKCAGEHNLRNRDGGRAVGRPLQLQGLAPVAADRRSASLVLGWLLPGSFGVWPMAGSTGQECVPLVLLCGRVGWGLGGLALAFADGRGG